jgi:hypothetical protein
VIWLTWRVERTTVITAAALVAVFAVVALLLKVDDPTGMTTARMLLVLGLPAFATVIAVFWGAPMVAREYEQHTYLLVWSRERPATRWLAARVGQLLAPLVVLTIGVNAIAQLLQDRMLGRLGAVVPPPEYDLWLPLQLGTVVAGFGLGVLVGVLVRNSVVAMGITLVGYVALRLALGVFARPHLLPAVRLIDTTRPDNSLFVGGGYLDAAGGELSALDLQRKCIAASSQADFSSCLTRNGAVHEFVDIQPADRIPDLRLVELAGYAALAVVVLAAAWLVLRRRVMS